MDEFLINISSYKEFLRHNCLVYYKKSGAFVGRHGSSIQLFSYFRLLILAACIMYIAMVFESRFLVWKWEIVYIGFKENIF